MNKTNVEDMLIEMIEPKVREIEEKFSKGDGLTQEDINTLLLKSQYNHINHLDLKLDEITGHVSNLESKFQSKFHELETRFQNLESKFQNLEAKFQILETKFDVFKAEMNAQIAQSTNKIMYTFVMVAVIFKALDYFV